MSKDSAARLLFEPSGAEDKNVPQLVEQPQKRAFLTQRMLLSVYLLIPISVAVVFIDLLFFDRALGNILPYSPEDMLLFNLFFVLPHITASTTHFFDSGYLAHYKTKLAIGLLIIMTATWYIPKIIGYDLYLLLFSAYTVYHVVGQQFGLTKMGLRKIDWRFNTWKWMGVWVAALIYVGLYPPAVEGIDLGFWLTCGAVVSVVPWLYIAWSLSTVARNSEGKIYIWCNVAMVAVTTLFFAIGYPFFVILIARVIHDLTAFGFYMVHDYNRNAVKKHNLLFRLTSFMPVHPFAKTALVSILIAMPFTLYQFEFPLVMYMVMVLGTFHYFTESFAWKNGSLHRESIAFK